MRCHSPPNAKKTTLLGLLVRKRRLAPSLLGWAGMLGAIVGAGFVAVHSIYPFLSAGSPVPEAPIAFSGTADDGALDFIIASCRSDVRIPIYSLGTEITFGAPFFRPRTWAEYGADRLRERSQGRNRAEPIAVPQCDLDADYAAALALRDWMVRRGEAPAALNVVANPADGRRADRAFRKAFGKGTRIGVILLPPGAVDLEHWWRTSSGFRTIVDEALSYTYARFTL